MADETDRQQFHRAPAVYKKISEIDPEKNIRVRLIGRVIGTTDGTIVIDDGSGRADIVADEIAVENNEIVRIFARVLPLENGYELRAELIQDPGLQRWRLERMRHQHLPGRQLSELQVIAGCLRSRRQCR